MWSLLAPFLIGRATGGWRYMRVLLLIVLIGCFLAGLIYVVIVLNAVQSRPETRHVQHHSSH